MRDLEAAANPLFTIGHSNHPLETFLALLVQHELQVLVDVRSQPYSRYSRHFDQPSLRRGVTERGLRYAFLGRELGGRPQGASFYDGAGHALYWRIAQASFFQQGIRWIEQGRLTGRMALMCSEENPLECHRSLLIARVLAERGIAAQHIRGDGSIQTEAELRVERSIGEAVSPQLSLFATVGQEDQEETRWRSARSVLRREPPPISSGH
ncbi:MAG TPA: DUF488 domain-containing protein [Steroidobacteraceae bacterium]|nr:DUF488 domain-containing protein [Steroidobacteraceae bacterium]